MSSTTPTPCIAYVLDRFGAPSETFIHEEMLSLLEAGQTLLCFRAQSAEQDVGHASVQRLRSTVPLLPMAELRRGRQLLALLRWLLLEPSNTCRVLARALRERQTRWLYWATLAPALQARQRGVRRFHAHFADAAALHAAAMASWCQRPFSLTTHRYDIFAPVLERDTLAQLLGSARPLVNISEFNRRYLAREFGTPGELVFCGVDLQRLTPQPRTPTEMFRLLSVGRLVPEKAQAVLLDAMALLKQRGRRIRLQLVGAGPLREALQAQAEKLGLQTDVEFLGARSTDEVIVLHAQADAFALPSRAEGLPVACIEALALGTPTVATAICGLPELILSEQTGLLVPPEDAQALADAIQRLMDDTALRDRLAHEGRRWVEQHFDRRRCTERLLQLWDIHVNPVREGAHA